MMPLRFSDAQKLPPEYPYIGVRPPEKLDAKTSASPSPGSILIVDDSADCRTILRMAIEQEGFCCVEAADGMAALNLFQEKSINFIITDFQMPNMNRCEFLEILSRAAVSLPPAVMITGSLTESVRIKAMQTGALAVLSKPFDRKKILKMIREIVNHKQEALL